MDPPSKRGKKRSAPETSTKIVNATGSNKGEKNKPEDLSFKEQLELAEQLFQLEREEKSKIAKIGAFIDAEGEKRRQDQRMYRDFTDWIAIIEKLNGEYERNDIYSDQKKTRDVSNIAEGWQQQSHDGLLQVLQNLSKKQDYTF